MLHWIDEGFPAGRSERHLLPAKHTHILPNEAIRSLARFLAEYEDIDSVPRSSTTECVVQPVVWSPGGGPLFFAKTLFSMNTKTVRGGVTNTLTMFCPLKGQKESEREKAVIGCCPQPHESTTTKVAVVRTRNAEARAKARKYAIHHQNMSAEVRRHCFNNKNLCHFISWVVPACSLLVLSSETCAGLPGGGGAETIF